MMFHQQSLLALKSEREQVSLRVQRLGCVSPQRSPASPVCSHGCVATLADRDLFFQDRRVFVVADEPRTCEIVKRQWRIFRGAKTTIWIWRRQATWASSKPPRS